MAVEKIKFALDFEKPVNELEKKINEMREYAASTGVKVYYPQVPDDSGEELTDLYDDQFLFRKLLFYNHIAFNFKMIIRSS